MSIATSEFIQSLPNAEQAIARLRELGMPRRNNELWSFFPVAKIPTPEFMGTNFAASPVAPPTAPPTAATATPAIKESDFSFYITCDEDDTLTASSKKTQLLLYWILEQFITWKQKPIFKNVEEIKLSLIYFINRVNPEINSLIRYQYLHACDPERFSTIEDIKKFEKESSRTFSLA